MTEKDKSFVKNGKWYRKLGKDSRQQLKKELGFFFFKLGKAEVVKQEQTFHSQINLYQSFNQTLTLQSQIKQKIPLLIRGQTYYRYNLDKSPYFFLFNTHNGSRVPPFQIGKTYQFQLKKGSRYPFFTRLLQKAVDLKRNI